MPATRSLVLAATAVAVLTTAPAAVARAEVETPPGQALAAAAMAGGVAAPGSVAAGVPEGAISSGLHPRRARHLRGNAPAVAPVDDRPSSIVWLGEALVLGLLTAGVIVSLRKRR